MSLTNKESEESNESKENRESKKLDAQVVSRTLSALQASVSKDSKFTGIQGARAVKLLNLLPQRRLRRQRSLSNSEDGESADKEENGVNEENDLEASNANEGQDVDESIVNTERMWIEAIAEEPKSAHLRTQLANYYFQQSRLKEASYSYEKAIQLDNTNIIAHYDYAFMKHHQFYFALAQFDLLKAQEYAQKALNHYHCVLKIAEDDIETHYQLSLLYLTLVETCMPLSVDNIQSILAVSSIELIESDICKLAQLRQVSDDGRVSKCPSLQNLSKWDEMRLSKIEKIDYPVARGRYSPWFTDRCEYTDLCRKHIEITLERVQENNPVLYGTYISHARLLYMECTLPLALLLTRDQKSEKLQKGISYLCDALEMNEYDATLHHDLALFYSHELVANYVAAARHWQIAAQVEENNYIYFAQLGYLYHYCMPYASAPLTNASASAASGTDENGFNTKRKNLSIAQYYYEKTLELKQNHHEIWNYLAILKSELGDFPPDPEDTSDAAAADASGVTGAAGGAEAAEDAENAAAGDGAENGQNGENGQNTQNGGDDGKNSQNKHKVRKMEDATKCWLNCLEINQLHCECHRNLGNAYWLFWKDSNKAEIHLQKAISVSKQLHEKLVQLIEDELKVQLKYSEAELQRKLKTIKGGGKGQQKHISMLYTEKNVEWMKNILQYYELILVKCKKFVAQTLSDYAGMLLMMHDNEVYHRQAENSLISAIEYDDTCVGAHYYLGKHYVQIRPSLRTDDTELGAKYHLNMYLTLEDSKNLVNLAHVNQLLGEFYMRQQQFALAEFHYHTGLHIIRAICLNVTPSELSLIDKSSESRSRIAELTANPDYDARAELAKLPPFAITNMHGGYAQALLIIEVLKMRDESWILEQDDINYNSTNSSNSDSNPSNANSSSRDDLDPSQISNNGPNTSNASNGSNTANAANGVKSRERSERSKLRSKSLVLLNTVDGRVTGVNRMFLGLGGVMLNKQFSDESVEKIAVMEKHFNIFLKMNPYSIEANLGLALLHRIFVHKPRKSEKFYRAAINLICRKLLQMQTYLHERLARLTNTSLSQFSVSNLAAPSAAGMTGTDTGASGSSANESGGSLNSIIAPNGSNTNMKGTNGTNGTNGINGNNTPLTPEHHYNSALTDAKTDDAMGFEKIDRDSDSVSKSGRSGKYPWEVARRPAKANASFESQFAWHRELVKKLRVDCENVVRLYKDTAGRGVGGFGSFDSYGTYGGHAGHTSVLFENLDVLGKNNCHDVMISEQNSDLCEECVEVMDDMLNMMLVKIDAHLGLSELLLASFTKQRWRECILQCKYVLRIERDNLESLQKIASLYFKLGMKRKALDTAQHALKVARELDEKRMLHMPQMQQMEQMEQMQDEKEALEPVEEEDLGSRDDDGRVAGVLEKKIENAFVFLFNDPEVMGWTKEAMKSNPQQRRV